jgi:hypothetical protein
MKQLIVAAFVVLSLGISASPSFAGWHYQRLANGRVVVVSDRGVRHRVVRYSVVRRPVVVYRTRVVHHRSGRFIPLPVPRRLPVPPPFYHPF